MSTSPRHLVVGVPTYRRNGPLAELLPLLLQQAREVQDGADIDRVELLVVDNDPDGGARVVTDRFGDGVRYHHEARPGLAHVRNALLDHAGEADLLACIDDDETPAPGWLVELVRLRARTGAQAVAGRVVSVPDGELDPFVAAGGFLDRSHRDGLRSGDRIDRAATNNLLLDLQFVRDRALRFDEAFGRTGGEDSLFTSTLVRSGGVLVWSPDAVVHDHVPADRMTPAYMLRRARNMANSGVFVELALRPTVGSRTVFRARHTAREVARAGQGAVLVARGRSTGSTRDLARGRRALARAGGALAGLAGRRTTHYAPAAGGVPPSPTPASTPGSPTR